MKNTKQKESMKKPASKAHLARSVWSIVDDATYGGLGLEDATGQIMTLIDDYVYDVLNMETVVQVAHELEDILVGGLPNHHAIKVSAVKEIIAEYLGKNPFSDCSMSSYCHYPADQHYFSPHMKCSVHPCPNCLKTHPKTDETSCDTENTKGNENR